MKALSFALLVSHLTALGTRGVPSDHATVTKIVNDSIQEPESPVFKFDVPPIVPNESIVNEQQEKGYRKPESTTRRNVPKNTTKKIAKAPTQGNIPSAAGTRRKLINEESRPVQTRRDVRKNGVQFDPASSIMAAVEQTKRRIIPQKSRDKVSKGYVKAPTKRQIDNRKRDQTRRRVDQAIVKPVKPSKRPAGPPLPPPPPPPSSSRRQKERGERPRPVAKPAVLAQPQVKRSPIAAASTRRVATTIRNPTRRIDNTVRAARGRDQRPLKIVQEGSLESTSEEQLIPARTVRKVEQPNRQAVVKPVKKQPKGRRTQQQTVYYDEPTDEGEEDSITSTTSVQPVKRKHRGKQPAIPVKTSRKVVKERKPVQTRRKVVESETDESTSTNTFEQQFTRRNVVKRKPKKTLKKRKQVEETEETTTEDETSSELQESESSSSSEYARKKPVKTKRRVTAGRKTERTKKDKARGRRKEETEVETTNDETEEETYERKRPQSIKRKVKVESTKRKVEPTKRTVAVTKRKVEAKKKPVRRGKQAKKRYETSEDTEVTTTEESTTYRPAATKDVKTKRTRHTTRRHR